jgi:caffeoyl-CoA O-methyltransferase
MDFLSPELTAYVEAYTSPENEVLRKLNRDTNAHVLMPRMLSGHLQGRVLSMFSHMTKPKQVLEIGTYTGYSALCFAEGLQPGGVVHTIDINEELEEMIAAYIKEAGMQDKVKYYIGNALDIIKSIKGSFDLVFIDADKENYSNYFDMVIDRIPSGGYIIADNVLWSGKVLERSIIEKDAETRAIDAFNKKVHADTRVENVLFPIRDGLMVIRKL